MLVQGEPERHCLGASFAFLWRAAPAVQRHLNYSDLRSPTEIPKYRNTELPFYGSPERRRVIMRREWVDMLTES